MQLEVLTDIEFEGLVADLLAADLNRHVERFARGRDGGIDLRWTTDSGDRGVGQAKHYVRSTFSQLLSAARAEAENLGAVAPSEYRFITSFDMSKTQKDQILKIFGSWIRTPEHVMGRRDIDGLMHSHASVVQEHPKLWLATGSQLFWNTHSDLLNRSRALRERIDQDLVRYVMNRSFGDARGILDAKRVCVIAGVPGIGKTTLAHILMTDATLAGYTPIEISADVSEAWSALDEGTPQVFLYDDFLGQLSFSERLGKNEDKRLTTFIRKVAETPRKRFILTTREYILRDARNSYEQLRRLGDEMDFVLKLDSYTRLDRAQILYNHLWHGKLSRAALAEVAAGGYKTIIDHPAYSPRLIEYGTGDLFDTESIGYVDRFVEMLDHPSELWRTAFESHVSREQQLLIVCLVTFARSARVDALQVAYESVCRTYGIAGSAWDFRRHLAASEGTFIEVFHEHGEPHVRYHNPSVREFVLDWIADDHQLIVDLVNSATYFEQLERLFVQGFGTYDYLVGSPARPKLKEVLLRDSTAIQHRFKALIDSESPTRVEIWMTGTGQVVRPPPGRLSDRVRFALELPESCRPDEAWFSSQLGTLANSWRLADGDKTSAMSLLSKLDESNLQIDAAALSDAHDALDGWFRSSLHETEEDWVPLMDRISNDAQSGLVIDEHLIDEFESHAREEIDRWDPEPPGLHELQTMATELQLGELIADLQEVIDQSAKRDEQADQERDEARVRATPGELRRSEAPTSATVDAMFRRLTAADPIDDGR